MTTVTSHEPAAMEALQILSEQVLTLGSLVETLLAEAVDLLLQADLDGLERLSDGGRSVREQRLVIELGCLRVLGSQRPPEGDLRLVVAIVEIASELERLADHVLRVPRANSPTATGPLRSPLTSLRRLSAEIQSLLASALASFAERDATAAREAAAGTELVEGLYQQVRRDLLAVMRGKPHLASQAIFVARSASSLRRAAQRVASVCEWVVFAVEGALRAGEAPPRSPVVRTEELSLVR